MPRDSAPLGARSFLAPPDLGGAGAPSWAALDDAQLVLALRDGKDHRPAANEIFRRYAPMVLRILKRSLGMGADVQDVVQEVFLRFFSRARRIEKPESMKHFLISVTIHVLKWELKRREVRRIMGLRPDPEPVDPPPAVEPDLDARAALRRFERVLNELPHRDRIVFTLRFLERLTLPEVAEALGVSLATAKRHIERARRAVTTALAGDPVLADFAARAKWQGEEE
jgi:RNA polymerase sigma-70 factor (ECF subfamily)